MRDLVSLLQFPLCKTSKHPLCLPLPPSLHAPIIPREAKALRAAAI